MSPMADLQAKTTLVTVIVSLDKLGIDFIVEIDPEDKIIFNTGEHFELKLS